MAKNYSIAKLVASLENEVGSVSRILEPGQLNSLLQCQCDLFRFTGEAVQAYLEAELDEDEQTDLDNAIKRLSDLDTECLKAKRLATRDHARALGAVSDEEDPDGILVWDMQNDHKENLLAITAEYEDKKTEHENRRNELQAKQGLAGLAKVRELTKWTDPNNSRKQSGSIPLPGNSFAVLDVSVQSAPDYKMHAVFCPKGHLYLWPYGSKVESEGPKLARETFHDLGELPITSPSKIQAVVWDSQYRYAQFENLDEMRERFPNVIRNGNLPKNYGGSRGVHHIVNAIDPKGGYTRQITLDEMHEKFGRLPWEPEPVEEPAKK